MKYFFIRCGCSEDDSRDLTQEVFLAAYRGLETFRGEAEPRTWLLRIARNRLLNFLRGRRAVKRFEPQPAKGSDEIGELPDADSRNPEDELLAAEEVAQIHSAIDDLPPKMRTVLRMRIQGLEYHEIAATMGLSIETVKSHLHQARARLRPLAGRLVAGRPGAGRPMAALGAIGAALLLLGMIAGWWLAAGRAEPNRFHAAASTQLLPRAFAVLGNGKPTEPANCPPASGSFVIVLSGLGPQAAASSTQVMLSSADREELRLAASANDFGEIELVLSRSLLGNGEYRIEVRSEAESGTAIDTYDLVVDCP